MILPLYIGYIDRTFFMLLLKTKSKSIDIIAILLILPITLFIQKYYTDDLNVNLF